MAEKTSDLLYAAMKDYILAALDKADPPPDPGLLHIFLQWTGERERSAEEKEANPGPAIVRP